jgi:hypothetical protein
MNTDDQNYPPKSDVILTSIAVDARDTSNTSDDSTDHQAVAVD